MDISCTLYSTQFFQQSKLTLLKPKLISMIPALVVKAIGKNKTDTEYLSNCTEYKEKFSKGLENNC